MSPRTVREYHHSLDVPENPMSTLYVNNCKLAAFLHYLSYDQSTLVT
jgi:hypothetical protein